MSLNAIAVSQETGASEGVMEMPADYIADGNPVSESWLSSEFPAEGKVRTGIWSGQPGTIKVPGYPTDEVFTVIEGRIEMTNEDGSVVILTPGKSVLMRKGWKGLFRIVEPSKKCFVSVG